MLCNGAMTKTTKCQSVGDAEGVLHKRLEGKGGRESAAWAAHAVTQLIWCGPEDRSDPAHPSLVTRNNNGQQSLVCAAFFMITSFSWMRLSRYRGIWKAMLRVPRKPVRVEIGSSFWKPGCFLRPSSNSRLSFHLFLEKYFCICFFKNKNIKVVKYLHLVGKNHVLHNLVVQLVP